MIKCIHPTTQHGMKSTMKTFELQADSEFLERSNSNFDSLVITRRIQII